MTAIRLTRSYERRVISRMLATLGRPPARFADFAVEEKYVGQRGMAVVDGSRVTLLSRNGANISRTFLEITSALIAGNRRVVLDGEIVALDEGGAPSLVVCSAAGHRTADRAPNFCVGFRSGT
jgi:ATP-dependent DNA ligase